MSLHLAVLIIQPSVSGIALPSLPLTYLWSTHLCLARNCEYPALPPSLLDMGYGRGSQHLLPVKLSSVTYTPDMSSCYSMRGITDPGKREGGETSSEVHPETFLHKRGDINGVPSTAIMASGMSRPGQGVSFLPLSHLKALLLQRYLSLT